MHCGWMSLPPWMQGVVGCPTPACRRHGEHFVAAARNLRCPACAARHSSSRSSSQPRPDQRELSLLPPAVSSRYTASQGQIAYGHEDAREKVNCGVQDSMLTATCFGADSRCPKAASLQERHGDGLFALESGCTRPMEAAGPTACRTNRLIRSRCYTQHRALLWAVKCHHTQWLQQQL